jgi:nucleotide-binding universal stress UspA family protein
MLKHVLVPLDGSLLAEKALDGAKAILQPQGRITLLTAVQTPTPPLYAYPSPDVLHEVQEDMEYVQNTVPRAAAYLDNIAQNLRLNGYTVDVEIATGDPADQIVRLAEQRHVDAIAISTHGRSGLGRWLFGSVTHKVLSATPCPIFVIPNREREKSQDAALVPGSSPHPA